MAKLVLKKGMAECDFHNDLFALHQNFGTVEDKTKYWDSLCDELANISRKYRGSDMKRWVDVTLIAFADFLNSKVAKPVYSDTEWVVRIVSEGRSKEEIEEIITKLQGVSE